MLFNPSRTATRRAHASSAYGRPRCTLRRTASIALYVLNLLPYIAISYYERYALPLIAVKVLLVIAAANRLLPSWIGTGPEEKTAAGPAATSSPPSSGTDVAWNR